MTGLELKSAREKKGWTQQQAAARLGVTQAYLSMLENGRREVSARLARKLQRVADLSATSLPLPKELTARLTNDDFVDELGSLGYPGFAYVRKKPKRNPAEVLMLALDMDDLDRHLAEALPWLVWRYFQMDWQWLSRQCKLRDRQNRLGFVTSLALQLANKRKDRSSALSLSNVLKSLERSRLASEDTYCRASMTNVERKWVSEQRTKDAAYWNILSDMKVNDLVHAFD